jgi:hypothetical protein
VSNCSNVSPAEPLSKDKFQTLLAAAWARTASAVGNQVVMAAKMGLSDPKVIGRATGVKNLPEAHTVFNSLCADETALSEVLSHYGYDLCRKQPEAANDLATLSGLCEVAAELSEALKDGKRVHPETLRIADKLRPHMASLASFLKEADELRGAA